MRQQAASVCQKLASVRQQAVSASQQAAGVLTSPGNEMQRGGDERRPEWTRKNSEGSGANLSWPECLVAGLSYAICTL